MKTFFILATAALFACPRQDIELQRLIERLGSDKVDEREAASRALVRIGRKALDVLRAAERSASLDIRQRAKDLIDEIDWPEPGTAAGGLAMAIKADTEYGKDGRILLRGRLINHSDKDLVVAGAHSEGIDEGGAIHLRVDGGDGLYHLCYRRREPAPDLPSRFTVKKGERKSFTFSPRAWCGQIEHSKCAPFAFEKPTAYRVSLVLILAGNGEGEWKGRIESNEASFRLK